MRKRIAITGASGLLGRNLLFEIAMRHLASGEEIEILLLGRGKGPQGFRARMREIMRHDGALYCGLTDPSPLIGFCDSNVRCIEMDLATQGLGLSADALGTLRAEPIAHFFHAAAVTDLRDRPAGVEYLRRTNVTGTRQLLDLTVSLSIAEFVYVGSAYACGRTGGLIAPDYVPSPDTPFRNPYEETKLDAELAVRHFAKQSAMRCRCFRPSIICGRLIEPPLGRIDKFDVFYGFAAFFLHAKMRACKALNDVYAVPIEMPVRVLCSEHGGLNIVPADFVAKAMYDICLHDLQGEGFHLVNAGETPHRVYIPLMANTVNVHGLKYVSEMPRNLSRLEAIFYKVFGTIFEPYTMAEPMLFDTSNVDGFLRDRGLVCPPVDAIRFMQLMDYAKSVYFGMAAPGSTANQGERNPR
jgi:nucleoside-diphosphate-sugar epimerase